MLNVTAIQDLLKTQPSVQLIFYPNYLVINQKTEERNGTEEEIIQQLNRIFKVYFSASSSWGCHIYNIRNR